MSKRFGHTGFGSRSAALAAAAMLVMASGVGAQASASSKLIPIARITIGYSVSTFYNQFFIGMTQGVTREAKALGVHLIVDNANGDPTTQLNQVEELVARHVNAIILNPIDARGIIPAIKAANAAHIPVITLDRTAFGGRIVSFIRDSSLQMSKEGAHWLADQLKKRYGSYRGNVVDLEGLMSSSPGQARQQGFMSVMKHYPHIKIIATLAGNFNQSTSFNDMTDVIRAHPNTQIDGVFNANDDNAVGGERAIQAAGLFKPVGSRKHIIIVGIDGTSQAFAAIRAGQQDVTVAQNPMKEAEASVQVAVESIEGVKVQSNIRWPHFLVTKSDINSLAAQEFGLWSLQLKNTRAGNIPDMKSLAVYTADGARVALLTKLYNAIK